MKLLFTLIISVFAFMNSALASSLLIIADEQANMKQLQKFLQEKNYAVQLVDQSQLPKDIAGFFAVFQYIHGTMTEETSASLIKYTNEGGRLILLHHALASARLKNPEFLAFAGIHLDPRDHPKTPWLVLETTHTIVNLNPSHYITSTNMHYPKTELYQGSDALRIEREYPAFDLPNTEVFLNQQCTDGTEKTILFGFKTINPKTGQMVQQDRSGWLKKAGKGWIIYFQAGHSSSDFQNPLYLQMIQNALTWNP